MAKCDKTNCGNRSGRDFVDIKNLHNQKHAKYTCFNNKCTKVCYYDSDCGEGKMCRPFRFPDTMKNEIGHPARKRFNNRLLNQEYKRKPKYSLCVLKDYDSYKLACSNMPAPTNFISNSSSSGIRTMSDCVDWSRQQKPLSVKGKTAKKYNSFIYKKAPDNDLIIDSIGGMLVCQDEKIPEEIQDISHIIHEQCKKNIRSYKNKKNTNIQCTLDKIPIQKEINIYNKQRTRTKKKKCKNFGILITDYECEHDKNPTPPSPIRITSKNQLRSTLDIKCKKPDSSICSVGYINSNELGNINGPFSKSCTTDNQGKKYPLYLLPTTDGMSNDDYIQDLKSINEEVAEELTEKIKIKKKALQNLITERNALTGNRDFIEQEELQKNEIKLLIRLFNERNKLQNNARSAYNNAASRANINSNAELKYNKMKINKLDKNIVTISRKILANNRRNKKDNLMGMILAVILFIVVVIASIMFIFYGVRSAKRMNSASVKTS